MYKRKLISMLLMLLSSECLMIAQTPFDDFAPETSRIILDKDSMDAWRAEQQRRDTIYLVLVDDEHHWISVDPLLDKNIATSPYMYCNGNPVMLIDPDGRDWYLNSENHITWTEFNSQDEMRIGRMSGKYLGEAVIIFNGYMDEKFGSINGMGQYIGGDGSKLAEVVLYGPTGADDITQDLVGFTMTSNYDLYGAIDNGIWPGNYDKSGKSGAIPSHWTLNQRGWIPTYDYRPNESPYAGRMMGTMYKDGIFIHSTKSPDNKIGSKTSVGCLLLDRNSMNIFNERMEGVQHFSVIVNRR